MAEIDPNQIESLNRAISSVRGIVDQNSSAMEKYFSSLTTLSDKIDKLVNALDRNTTTQSNADTRRMGVDGSSSNAYSQALQGKNPEFLNNLTPAQRRSDAYQAVYGVTNEQGDLARGVFNFRRNVGALNLPNVAQALRGGEVQQAAGMFVTGLAKTPYVQPFAAGAEARMIGQGADYARNRVIGQRLGEPTMMGLQAGYTGSGAEGYGSGLGSFVSSLGAMPSMAFGYSPNAIGNLFGASMSPAATMGYQMRFEALKGSLNPFSMMGYNQYLGIQQAVAGKGFESKADVFNISRQVKDLVQKVGVDSGAAIDILDLAIKRLYMDVDDATNMMANFGDMAKGAGKGVAQFTQEVAAVMKSMSAQGARGPSVLSSSALLSSLPQVTGQGVYNLVNNPTMIGLTMGAMGAKGMAAPDMAMAAMGAPFLMQGGTQSNTYIAESMQQFRNFIDTLGPNKDLAYVMAGQIFGMDPQAVRDTYLGSEKMINQAKVLQSMENMDTLQKYSGKTAASEMFAQGKGGKFKAGKIESAFQELRGAVKATQQGKGAGMTGTLIGGVITVGSTKKNINNQKFNGYVQKYAQALLSANPDDATLAIEDEMAQEMDINPDEVARAASLIVSAGQGNRSAMKELYSEFDVSGLSSRGEMGPDYKMKKSAQYLKSSEFRAAENKLRATKRGDPNYKKQATQIVQQAFESDLIKQGMYDKYMKQIESGAFDIDTLKKQILKTGAKQQAQQQQDLIRITLDQNARRLLRFLPRAGSTDDEATVPRNAQSIPGP